MPVPLSHYDGFRDDWQVNVAELLNSLEAWQETASTYARGLITIAVGTSAQSGIGSTPTALTGCTVTFTADPTRFYRTRVILPRISQSSSAGITGLFIYNASSAITNQCTLTLATGGDGHLLAEIVEFGLDGSTTRAGRINTTAGTVATTAGWLPTITVEDIGGT